MSSGAENLSASRLRGSLLGLAWGDALGCPVEFWDTAEVRQVYGHYTDLPMAIPFARLPAREEIWAHLRPLGLHSDDTQQALALIQTCLAPAGWQMDAWADLLVRLLPTSQELKVGVVTALVGAPIFLVLLIRTRKSLF